MFAHAAEPSNSAVEAKLKWAQEQRKAGRVTVPSTIGSEKETNPFVRVREQTIQDYCGICIYICVYACYGFCQSFG